MFYTCGVSITVRTNGFWMILACKICFGDYSECTGGPSCAWRCGSPVGGSKHSIAWSLVQKRQKLAIQSPNGLKRVLEQVR